MDAIIQRIQPMLVSHPEVAIAQVDVGVVEAHQLVPSSFTEIFTIVRQTLLTMAQLSSVTCCPVVGSKVGKPNGQDLVRINGAQIVGHKNTLAITLHPIRLMSKVLWV